MTTMRAKVRVGAVLPVVNTVGTVTQERLMLHAVGRSDAYPNDGSDENNTFAQHTPSATFDMLIANPALIGAFAVNDVYYVDFTPAE